MKSTRFVAKRVKRVDAFSKVTGRAIFAEDIKLPGMLYGAVLRSPYPHAKIISIDKRRALRKRGVIAVLTAQDIPGERNVGIVIKDQPVIAYEKVRYIGDGVALVAATSMDLAREALELIGVEYEILPGVFDPEEALKKDSPRVHEKGNLIVYHKVRKGDVEKGFKEADLVIEREYSTGFVEHAYIEPEAVVAEPTEDGGVRVTGCIQNAFTTQKNVASVLGVDNAKVRIVQSALGGSFGGKDDVMTVMAARAALLAHKTGKPVKMVNTREESMRESYKRHPYRMRYRIGVKEDGIITALEAHIIADGGAYASTTPFVTWRSTVQAAGPYRIPNVKVDTYGVYTNNIYTGAMRGFGSPQVNFAIESLMDEVAEALSMDPLELRLKNALTDGDITATGQKLTHRVSLKETLLRATQEAGWREKREKYRKEKGRRFRRGIGLASSFRGVSLGAEGVDAAGIEVKVEVDGSVVIEAGIADMGQGARTVLVQMVAEELGVPMEKITILPYDTSRVPDSGPTVASRATLMGGKAAQEAAGKIKEILLEVAREILNSTDVRLEGGFFISSKGKIPFNDIVKKANEMGRSLNAIGWFKAPSIRWDEERGKGEPYFTYVYGTQVAEVEVDMETGKVRVLNVTAAHEVGRAINPAMAEGQIFGGVMMALGYALLEEFEIKDGIPRVLNFDEYLIPTASDTPNVKAILIENPDPIGPYGAKSLGEPTNEILAPAIANAIYNATGKRIRELPISLEQVFLGRKLERDR
jgi:CO/xanthine dehydrogenase Mo-binding subunit